MLIIYYSPRFVKMYKRFPSQVKSVAEERERTFRQSPFHPQLRTHKLTGRLKNYWAFSIGYHYRIVFPFISDTEVHFHAVGAHGIYRNLS